MTSSRTVSLDGVVDTTIALVGIAGLSTITMLDEGGPIGLLLVWTYAADQDIGTATETVDLVGIMDASVALTGCIDGWSGNVIGSPMGLLLVWTYESTV